MKTFLVLYKGSGEGCDYTIDCNKTWKFIEAETMDDAIKELMSDNPNDFTAEDIDDVDEYDLIWHRYKSGYEFSYSYIEIFEIAQRKDLGPVCEEYKAVFAAKKKELAAEKTKQAELKEYNRLKEKFKEK